MTDIAPQKARETGLTVKLVSEMTGFSPAEIALVARTVAIGATLQELAVFLHSCRALQLDPLLRQAYWIRRSGKGALQVGIDGFRAIAERSGAYAGAESIDYRGAIEWRYGKDTLVVPEVARATIWKIVGGHKNAFVGEAYWSEFVPPQDKDAFMWSKMPRLMLGKCAEAQALRRAFPAQLGGVAMEASLGETQQVTEQPGGFETQRNAQRYDEIFRDDFDAKPSLPEGSEPAKPEPERPSDDN